MTDLLPPPPLEPPYGNGPPPGYYFAPIPQPEPAKAKLNMGVAILAGVGALTVAIVTVAGINAFVNTNHTPQYQLGSYPAVYEQSFLNGCEGKGGSVSQCTCALNWVERNMSIDQAVSEGNSFSRTGVLSPNMTEAGRACTGA
jgi:hypothetical protein